RLVATEAHARLRVLRGAGRAGVSGKAGRTCPLLRVSRGEQQRVPAGQAHARREGLERGAVARELCDDAASGQSRRPGDQSFVAAPAGAGTRRRSVSLRRPAVFLQQRSRLEDAGRVDQWSEARRGEEVAARPAPLVTTMVLMRLGTSPTGITAMTFMALV